MIRKFRKKKRIGVSKKEVMFRNNNNRIHIKRIGMLRKKQREKKELVC